MEEEERIRILELAYQLVTSSTGYKSNEDQIKEWAQLFDQAYKAIMKTALEK